MGTGTGGLLLNIKLFPCITCPDFCTWMFATRSLLYLTLQVRVRPTPNTLLAAHASREEWYAWSSDASRLDMTWPRGGIFATTCSCVVCAAMGLCGYAKRLAVCPPCFREYTACCMQHRVLIQAKGLVNSGPTRQKHVQQTSSGCFALCYPHAAPQSHRCATGPGHPSVLRSHDLQVTHTSQACVADDKLAGALATNTHAPPMLPIRSWYRNIVTLLMCFALKARSSLHPHLQMDRPVIMREQRTHHAHPCGSANVQCHC